MTPPPVRPAARAFVAALSCLALGLTLLALVGGDLPGRSRLALTGALAIGVALASSFPLDFAFRTKFTMDTAVIAAAVLILPPGLAMLAAGAGVIGAHAARPTARDPTQASFNAALAALQAGLGAALLAATGWDPAQPAFDQPAVLLLVVAAGVGMHFLNVLGVATVVALQEELPVVRSWGEALREDAPAEVGAQVALLALGVLAAIVADAHPWALALLAAPVGGVFLALREHVRLRRQAEEARLGSDAGLAEAQRIARLGSWEWDLATGRQRWSDEAFRVLGLAPSAVDRDRDAFLGRVHPQDRASVEAVVGRAAKDGTPFGIEHRVLLVDGSERVVHLRGEAVGASVGRQARLVGTVQDVTERKVLEAMLAHRAFHDPLTGLPNRALFADTLARALGHDPRHPGRVAVLFLDLDGFKLVNDSLGHTAGDQLLGLVAARLRAHVPLEGTVVARFGGDEFAVLLERVADPTTVTHLAERLLEALRAPFALDGHETFVNACVGVAVGVLGEDDSGTLLRHADIALYRAKANGPSSVAVFAPVMEERVLARLQREVALRRAVEGGELRLHYQPVVELASGRMVGAEALVRWAHPELGLLLPVEFIPLAEETGLIVPLGNWVLGEACRQARAWQDATWSAPMGVSVNLSARQLRDPDLVAEVAGMLRENGLDARRLELEVTETVAMADAAVTRHALSALRRLGVRVSIDDFGTGHSSLGRLQELAPDALKIDRSFIAGLSRDRGSEAIVRAVSAMAHDLGLEVTAEGIETAEQAACLRTLGVDRGQGFYLGPPVPSEAVDALLTRPAPMPLSRQSAP